MCLQPAVKLLAGFEERMVLLMYGYLVAGTRVAAGARVALPYRERAEATHLDPIATRQGCGDLVEDRGDSDLGIEPGKMPIGLPEPLHKLASGHGGGPAPSSFVVLTPYFA